VGRGELGSCGFARGGLVGKGVKVCLGGVVGVVGGVVRRNVVSRREGLDFYGRGFLEGVGVCVRGEWGV